jgi:hypothetical protein
MARSQYLSNRSKERDALNLLRQNLVASLWLGHISDNQPGAKLAGDQPKPDRCGEFHAEPTPKQTLAEIA